MSAPGDGGPGRLERLFALVLRAYPTRFRRRFETGLRFAFSEELAAARRRGVGRLVWFSVMSVVRALYWALRERISPSAGPRGADPNGTGPAGRSASDFTADGSPSALKANSFSPRFTTGHYFDRPAPTRGWESMTATMRDLRHARRRLFRAPVYSLTVLISLALGIGASTAIYSVVYGVLLKPLPYPEAHRVMKIKHVHDSGELSMPDGGYFQYSKNARSFERIAIYYEQSAPIVGTGEPLELGIIAATPSLFDVLDVRPVLGRAFTEEDAAPGVDDVAIISHEFWVSRFGRDPDVLGKPVAEGTSIPIVGVLPEGFDFIRPEARVTFGNRFREPAIYVPLTLDESSARFGNFIYEGLGRLAAGATREEAERELTSLMIRAPEAYPGGHTVASLEEAGLRPIVVPLHEAMVGHVARVLWILMGAVGFVLVIATANVANLFLVSAESRRDEIALSRALGAGRGALARSFLVESLLLAGVGGAVGVGLAAVGTPLLLRLAPADVPRLDQVGLDYRVLVFATAVSIAVGIGFGTLPLFRFARLRPGSVLGRTSRIATASRDRQRGRDFLVATQVALAVVLLVGASLLLRTYANLRHVDPGFDSSGVLTLRLSLAPNVVRAAGIEEERSDVGRSRFLLELTRRLEELPTVDQAVFSADLPLNGEEWRDHVSVEGDFPNEGDLGPIALRVFVGPGYLDAIGARMIRGRELERRDFEGFPDGVVVNESFARRHWPGEDPVGKRLVQWPIWKPESVAWYTVLGVVEDVHESSLMTPPEPTVYLPTYFLPTDGFAMWITNMVVLVRTAGDPVSVLPEVRRAIVDFHPEVPVNSVETLASIEARSYQQVSFAMLLVVIAASVALVLGIVGIYALVAYVVSKRTSEFGLRIALGATASDVRWAVLRRGALAGLVGIALGILGARASGWIVESMLFGISTADVGTYLVVSIGLLLVVVVAGLVPAQRATRVDPVTAMRVE